MSDFERLCLENMDSGFLSELSLNMANNHSKFKTKTVPNRMFSRYDSQCPTGSYRFLEIKLHALRFLTLILSLPIVFFKRLRLEAGPRLG